MCHDPGDEPTASPILETFAAPCTVPTKLALREFAARLEFVALLETFGGSVGDLLGNAVGTVGMPNGRVPPHVFGISTRRTGGGK